MLKRLGFITRRECQNFADSSPFLQYHNFYEVHESGAINAEPEDIIAALEELDMRNDKLADMLLSVREFPGKFLDFFRTRRGRKKFTPFGFNSFTLLLRSSHELSLGLAGRFWRPDLVINEVDDAQKFKLLDDPKAAKLVVRFKVIEYPEHIHALRAETFVYCPNIRVKILFTPYWLAIRLASGWIRQRTLISIQKKLSMEQR